MSYNRELRKFACGSFRDHKSRDTRYKYHYKRHEFRALKRRSR